MLMPYGSSAFSMIAAKAGKSEKLITALAPYGSVDATGLAAKAGKKSGITSTTLRAVVRLGRRSGQL